MHHTHHVIQHSSLKAYARAEKPGTHRKNTEPEINSLRAIRTAKPSVCLSSLVSSTVGDYLALGFGGHQTVRAQLENSQLVAAWRSVSIAVEQMSKAFLGATNK